mmetsp:Transcript_25315/g.74086  ORF Transcript_25315/g.74086 Transcript_25315/m.74086 type:complete len:109 (+) Transcript_25315:57-383(+)
MGDSNDVEVVEPVPAFDKLLAELRCTKNEFIFLCVFWLTSAVLASYIDPAWITESTPVVLLLKLTDFLPILTYISIFVGGLYAAYTFRTSLIGALSSVLSRLTRSKRR